MHPEGGFPLRAIRQVWLTGEPVHEVRVPLHYLRVSAEGGRGGVLSAVLRGSWAMSDAMHEPVVKPALVALVGEMLRVPSAQYVIRE